MAKVMVEVCMDPRYRKGEKYDKPLHDFLVSIGAQNCYLISVPGASLEYTKPACEGAILNRIEIARAKKVERYILFDHLTCAAFPEDLDIDAERDKHLDTMEVAKQWHAKNNPSMTFEMYLHHDDDPTHFEPID